MLNTSRDSTSVLVHFKDIWLNWPEYTNFSVDRVACLGYTSEWVYLGYTIFASNPLNRWTWNKRTSVWGQSPHGAWNLRNNAGILKEICPALGIQCKRLLQISLDERSGMDLDDRCHTCIFEHATHQFLARHNRLNGGSSLTMRLQRFQMVFCLWTIALHPVVYFETGSLAELWSKSRPGQRMLWRHVHYWMSIKNSMYRFR